MTELPRPPHNSLPGGLTPARLVAQGWLNSLLDLVFPPRCVHCGRSGALLCTACQSLIQPAHPIQGADGPLDGRRATALFDGPIQSAIHALKYKKQTRINVLLAERLRVELQVAGWRPDLISAVPLHLERLRERGYNQSALLAQSLAERTGLTYCAEAVSRIRNTRQQVGLGAREREANMVDAFRAASALVKGKAVLIIDDVYTTGATMRSCAAALREAGAAPLWALTVASTSRATN